MYPQLESTTGENRLNTWLSILPPLIAIAVAVWRKEVVLALLVGIFLAEAILVGFNPALGFTGTFERCVDVFSDSGNARVLLFGLVVGALLELMQASGGVSAFVERLTRTGLTKTPRQVSWLTTIIGMSVFVETSMSCLASGVVSQNLYDRFKMSRARLAYIVDSTCAPISVLVLINGWGAYILGLLGEQSAANPVDTMVRSIPYNFYALITLAMVFYTATTTRVYGPMRREEGTIAEQPPQTLAPATKARFMLVPLLVLITAMIAFMIYTGQGNLLDGSGSKSVLWSVCLATVVSFVMLKASGVFTHQEMITHSYRGMSNLLPVVTIMLLSFAIGASCRDLGTGPFVASILGDFLPHFMLAPLLFICAAPDLLYYRDLMGHLRDFDSRWATPCRADGSPRSFRAKRNPGWRRFRRPLFTHFRYHHYFFIGQRL